MIKPKRQHTVSCSMNVCAVADNATTKLYRVSSPEMCTNRIFRVCTFSLIYTLRAFWRRTRLTVGCFTFAANAHRNECAARAASAHNAQRFTFSWSQCVDYTHTHLCISWSSFTDAKLMTIRFSLFLNCWNALHIQTNVCAVQCAVCTVHAAHFVYFMASMWSHFAD